jgi:hypothetical protein
MNQTIQAVGILIARELCHRVVIHWSPGTTYSLKPPEFGSAAPEM